MRAKVYRKRPIVVQAMRWTGDNQEDLEEWTSQTQGFVGVRDGDIGPGKDCLWLFVRANTAWLPLEVGEWILLDNLGFYPCKPGIFAKTYEADNGDCWC